MNERNIAKISCPICKSTDSRIFFNLDKGWLTKCSECSLIFYAPRPTAKELEEYYNSQSYRDAYRSGDMVGQGFADNRYRQFNIALNQYGLDTTSIKGKRLLDVGCGTGEFLSAAAQNGWQVEGVEVSDETVKAANQRLGAISVKPGLIGDIEIPDNEYNVITSYHVVEHLLNPMVLLGQAYRSLKPGGIIFLETPNIGSFGARVRGKNWSQIKPPEHINYFNDKSLSYALKQAGFIRSHVFTIRPQKIKSAEKFGGILQKAVVGLYGIAPLLNLGASLQAIATKPIVSEQ